MDKQTSPGFQPSEGTYLYLLGLVIIATQASRFWLGIVLAGIPVLSSAVGRMLGGWRA